MKITAPIKEKAVFDTIAGLGNLPDTSLVMIMRSWHFSYERATTQRNRIDQFCRLMLLADGAVLSEVKKRVGHGKYLTWVKKNCPFSLSSAGNRLNFYNALATDPDGLEAAWNKLPPQGGVLKIIHKTMVNHQKNPAKPKRKTMTFKNVSAVFKTLRKTLAPDVPLPKLKNSLPSDPYEFTTSTEIHLNIKEAAKTGTPPEWYAAHVFGHWLVDVHAKDTYTEIVADIIAEMTLQDPRIVKALAKMPKTKRIC